MTKHDARVNYGIVADSVKANALAVGENASATVHSGDSLQREDLEAALAALRAEIQTLKLPAASLQMLQASVESLQKESMGKPGPTQGSPYLLQGLIDKLKMAGVALESVAGLAKPLKVIAGWFGLPLPF